MKSVIQSVRGFRAIRLNRAVCAAALSAAALFASDRALAADISWTRASGNPGSFGDGANWAGGVVPGPADNGFINNGGISTFGAGLDRTGCIGSACGGNRHARRRLGRRARSRPHRHVGFGRVEHRFGLVGFDRRLVVQVPVHAGGVEVLHLDDVVAEVLGDD